MPTMQRSGESRSLRDGDGIDRRVSLLRFSQRLAHDGDNRTQMLARRQFRHDSTIGLMRCDLRSYDVRDYLRRRTHHGCSSFIAGAFDAEDVASAIGTSFKL